MYNWTEQARSLELDQPNNRRGLDQSGGLLGGLGDSACATPQLVTP